MIAPVRVAAAFDRLTMLDPDSGRELPAELDGDILTIDLGPARGVVLSIER